MKSEYQDQINTSCKDCKFAIYEKETQKDCEAGRVSTFKKRNELIEAYDEDKEFYTISRLCNLATFDNVSLEEARKKAAPSIDIFVECSDIKLEDYHEGRQEALQRLASKFNYYEGKLRPVFMVDQYKTSKDQRAKVYELHSLIKSDIMSYASYEFSLHERCYKSVRSYHCIASINDDFKNTFYKLDKLINEDLEKIVTCKIDGITFISNLAYKIHALNKEKVEHGSNIKEVIAQSKERNLHREL